MLNLLKHIRFWFALVAFILLFFVFINIFGLLSTNFKSIIIYPQFLPSIIKFLNTFSITMAGGFLLIIILTFLFGRLYCSFFCPLGILQDIILFFKRKLSPQIKYKENKKYTLLWYSLLIITIVLLISSSNFFVTLLDPYSNFGRIMCIIFLPVVNLLELFFGINPFFLEFEKISGGVLIYTISFLILIILLTIYYGRLFCNSICPVGAFLGLISKLSLFKIRIDIDNCKSCELCKNVCKAGCIHIEKKYIDFSRCIDCYNCLNVCKSGGIKYKIFASKRTPIFQKKDKIDTKRRKFIKELLGYTGIGIIAYLSGKILSFKRVDLEKEEYLELYSRFIIPPGAWDISKFTERCTACYTCISACPTGAIQENFLRFGLNTAFQPCLDFSAGYCKYDCNICSQVCPAGAILPVSVQEKQHIQIAYALFFRNNCKVTTEGIQCGICAKNCPVNAIQMIQEENLYYPQINIDKCIGCGKCEFICPARPKAIIVYSYKEHKII